MSVFAGLYVESHGVVHNLAFDAATHEMTGGWSETMNSTWWFNFAGEPLWITAITQGLSAGSFMYPGGQTPIDGILPNCYIGYSTKVYQNLIDRAEVVFDWLYEDNLDVVFLYVGKLDDALHYTGFSEETERVAGEVNELISYILAKMAGDSNVGDNLNFIVASDHGMAKISGDKALSLFDYIDESKVGMLVSDGGSIFQIQPVQGALEEVTYDLSNKNKQITLHMQTDPLVVGKSYGDVYYTDVPLPLFHAALSRIQNSAMFPNFGQPKCVCACAIRNLHISWEWYNYLIGLKCLCLSNSLKTYN